MRVRMMSVVAALFASVGLLVGAAQAAGWPERTIRIVVPAPPGSATDLLARILSDRLPAVLGQPVIVDNRPGGGTNIGTEHVARQPADGYTLLLTQNTLVSNIGFYKKLPFDPIADFEPISLIAMTPLALIVNADSPVRSVKELVDLARTKRISYGSAGVGSPHHLVMVLLNTAAGVEMIHAPYKGSSPVAVAVAGKEIVTGMSAVGSVRPHVQSGKLRVLAVSDSKRSALMPDAPPIADTFPGVAIDIWLGVLAPAGTPRPIIERLSTEIASIMRDPQIAASRLSPAGIEGVGSTPERFREVIKADAAKYRTLVKAANITPQ